MLDPQVGPVLTRVRMDRPCFEMILVDAPAEHQPEKELTAAVQHTTVGQEYIPDPEHPYHHAQGL